MRVRENATGGILCGFRAKDLFFRVVLTRCTIFRILSAQCACSVVNRKEILIHGNTKQKEYRLVRNPIPG